MVDCGPSLQNASHFLPAGRGEKKCSSVSSQLAYGVDLLVHCVRIILSEPVPGLWKILLLRCFQEYIPHKNDIDSRRFCRDLAFARILRLSNREESLKRHGVKLWRESQLASVPLLDACYSKLERSIPLKLIQDSTY